MDCSDQFHLKHFNSSILNTSKRAERSRAQPPRGELGAKIAPMHFALSEGRTKRSIYMYGTSRPNFPIICANLEREMEACHATPQAVVTRHMDTVQLHRRRSPSPKVEHRSKLPIALFYAFRVQIYLTTGAPERQQTVWHIVLWLVTVLLLRSIDIFCGKTAFQVQYGSNLP